MSSLLDFIHLFESDLGVPQGGNNDAFLIAWQKAEGTPGIHQNNPWNIAASTAKQGGGGTARFATPAEGAQFTADYIKRNANGMYKAFFGDLQANADPKQTAVAVADSPWASGHYKGNSGVPGTSIIGALGVPLAQASAEASKLQISTVAYIPGTHVHIPGTGSGSNVLPGAVDPGSWVSSITDWLQSVAIRTGLVLFGAIAVIVGLAILARDSGGGSSSSSSGSGSSSGRSSSSSPSSSSSSSSPSSPMPRRTAGHPDMRTSAGKGTAATNLNASSAAKGAEEAVAG